MITIAVKFIITIVLIIIFTIQLNEITNISHN